MTTNSYRPVFSTQNPELQEWDVSALDQMIGDVKQAHFKLLWVAGKEPGRRSAFLSQLAGKMGFPILNVGKLLASGMIDQPVHLRPSSAEDGFYDLLHQSGTEMLCLDHLEILFDQALMLKAVDLIRNASRRFILIAAWPGTLDTKCVLRDEIRAPEMQETGDLSGFSAKRLILLPVSAIHRP